MRNEYSIEYILKLLGVSPISTYITSGKRKPPVTRTSPRLVFVSLRLPIKRTESSQSAQLLRSLGKLNGFDEELDDGFNDKHI